MANHSEKQGCQPAHHRCDRSDALLDAMRTLQRADRQLRQAERMANIGSWRRTLADNMVEWSDQTYVIHGLPVGDRRVLSTALDFYPQAAREIIDASVARTIATGEPFEVETDFRTAQGDYRRVRSMGELEIEDGKPVALIGVFQDITTRYLLEQQLRQAAATDVLTDIASRGRFNEVAEEAIVKAVASGGPLALLLLDLDHFKIVNDRCGHATGDEVLRLMAARLKAPYLEGSFAARLGGDEFVLLVTSQQLLSDLPGLLRMLLRDLHHSVSDNGTVIHVSTTIGACWLEAGIANRGELLRRADAALYRAKNARRGSAMISGRPEHIALDRTPPPALRVVV